MPSFRGRGSAFVLVLGLALFALPGIALAQGVCGTAAGLFQIDGQFYSANGLVDWAQGDSGQGVFDASGNPLLTPSIHDRDPHWAGNATDMTAFSGSGNKNNDDISPGEQPWSWGPGSGPAKNDLTDVYAHSARVSDHLWLFLGASTRANNGASHIDFEFNQAGFTRLGTTSGTIVGNGSDAGRTAGIDFIVSVDYTDGGSVPVVSFRTWQWVGDHFEFVPEDLDPAAVFVCTNDTDVPAPPWGAIAPNGDPSDTVIPYQFVEIGVDLTALMVDPSVFCTDVSTLLFKTRSAPSFTAELKDLALYPFSILEPPACAITPDRESICEGETVELCTPEAPAGANYSYAWSGPGGPYADAPCITTGLTGTYSVVVTDLDTGCASEGCSYDLVVHPLPPCTITADTNVICADGSARFCGPEAPAGSAYSYQWDGPAGPYPDQRCLDVTAEGMYSLTVTDLGTGCQSAGSCQATLTVHPLPESSITGAGLICQDGQAELCGPEGNFEYRWDGPAGPYGDVRCILTSTAGTYRLVIVDRGTGCVSTPAVHELLVAGNPGCEITGPASVCPDSFIELCGPEGDFTYSWEGPGGPYPDQACIEVQEPGAYQLTVGDSNGCLSVCEHEVTLDANVSASELEDLWLCTGERAEFCVTASGTGPLTFQWFHDGSPIEGATDNCYAIPSLSGGDVGTYSVDVSGKCNTVTRSASLDLADVEVSSLTNLYLCEGQTAEICPVVTGRGPFTYTWRHDGMILAGQNDSCLVIDEVTDLDEGEYCVTVQGYCGDPVEACGTLYVGTCEEFCGLTQGFYGNAGGKWNGLTTLELLDQLITAESPLRVGVLGVRSVTFAEGSEECVINLLPGGGPAKSLPEGLGDVEVDPTLCETDPPLQHMPGRLRNILLAQTITLSLNVRLDPNLNDMDICGFMIMIPILPGPDGLHGTGDDIPDNDHPRFVEIAPSVLDALDALELDHTVWGLLTLANRSLAGNLPFDLNLGDVAGAVGSINDLVDECALTIHCEAPVEAQAEGGRPLERLDSLDDGQPTVGARPDRPVFGMNLLSASPIQTSSGLRVHFSLPEESRVRFAVFDVTGRIVAEVPESVSGAGEHTMDLDLDRSRSTASGVYFLRLEARGVETGTAYVKNHKMILIR